MSLSERRFSCRLARFFFKWTEGGRTAMCVEFGARVAKQSPLLLSSSKPLSFKTGNREIPTALSVLFWSARVGESSPLLLLSSKPALSNGRGEIPTALFVLLCRPRIDRHPFSRRPANQFFQNRRDKERATQREKRCQTKRTTGFSFDRDSANWKGESMWGRPSHAVRAVDRQVERFRVCEM